MQDLWVQLEDDAQTPLFRSLSTYHLMQKEAMLWWNAASFHWHFAGIDSSLDVYVIYAVHSI